MQSNWPLAWRFGSLPDVAAQIQVLDRTQDRSLREWIRQQASSPYDFDRGATICFDMETNEVTGREILTTLPVSLDESCSVVWAGPFDGCRLPVQLCLEYFYDVWYPASDDLWVIPDSRTWFLQCDHHGRLRFVALK